MRTNAVHAAHHALGVIFVVSLIGCNDDVEPAASASRGDDRSGGATSAGAGGSGGASIGGNPSSGGSSAAGANMGGANIGGANTGGANTGGANTGGTNGGGSIATGGTPSRNWTNVSPPSSDDNCSGVVVNRLTGEVLTDVTDQGIWRSTNRGADWERVDGNAVGGLIVLGPRVRR